LQILAPALRACLPSSDSQLKRFADVSESALLAAVDASVASLKQQLLRLHREVKNVAYAKLKLEEALKNGLDKYSIREMTTGSIDDFHKGLSDRVGEQRSPRAGRVHCICTLLMVRFLPSVMTLEQVWPVLIFSMQCVWNT
jgi:hypothetical protein